MATRNFSSLLLHYIFSTIVISLALVLTLLVKNYSTLNNQTSLDLLWSLIANSSLVVAVLAASLALSLYLYRKRIRGKIKFTEGLGICLLLVTAGSIVAGTFQIIYANTLNSNYLNTLKAQDKLALENLGLDPVTIESTLASTYSNWGLFSNTFFYFFLLGLFVSVLVTAYAYRRPIQKNSPQVE